MLFGWTASGYAAAGGRLYTLFQSGGQDGGGPCIARPIGRCRSDGGPISQSLVSAERSAAKIRAGQRGKVIAGPFDVRDDGPHGESPGIRRARCYLAAAGEAQRRRPYGGRPLNRSDVARELGDHPIPRGGGILYCGLFGWESQAGNRPGGNAQ